jgi:hypothetical protein
VLLEICPLDFCDDEKSTGQKQFAQIRKSF